ncbi:MAG: hypothetical protein ABEK02_09620, partial [Haloquadratum sp.]
MFDRRSFLRTAIAALGASVAGCTSQLDAIGEAGSQPTATATAVPEIPDAVFTFEYAAETQSLRVTFKGGDRPRAGRLLIRSSDGTASRWNELGSTAVTGGQRLRQGQTATLSESVINWRDPVAVGERIKIVYRPGGDSPATIAQFDTRAAVTARATQTPPTTATPTPTPTPTP